MSREAFGDPPEPMAPRCPVCDGTEHTNDCELGEEMAKRQQCERELAEWREMALSQTSDAGIVARMVGAETEVALLHAAMRDEMDEGLRLRELGGALPDENITAMTERVIAERDKLKAAIGEAYGYLWCVNNEPGTPHRYLPERAAYEARKVLRETLTKEERGRYINDVMPKVRGATEAP